MGADVALDMGTSTTRVFFRGDGTVLEEPSVVAVDAASGQIVGVGREAISMVGRTAGYVVLERPVHHGSVSRFELARRMLRLMLRQGRSSLGRLRVVACTPSGGTAIERRALEEVIFAAGASEVAIVEQPMAAALGSGLDVSKPLGQMVVDLGAGKTEAAVVCLGAVVAYRRAPVGGDDVDSAIAAHIRSRHGVLVPGEFVTRAKLSMFDEVANSDQLATDGNRSHRERPAPDGWPEAEPGEDAVGEPALPPRHEAAGIEVAGRDLSDGSVRHVLLDRSEVAAAFTASLSSIARSVAEAVTDAPGELAHDLLKCGMHLVGGGARSAALAQVLARASALPTRVVDDPERAVLRGASVCLEDFDRWRELLAATSP